MKHFSLKQLRSNSFVGLLILFILIYTSEDTMLFGTFGSSTYNMIKYIVLVVLTLYLMIKKPTYDKNSVAYILLLVFLYVVSSLISGGLKIGFIYNIVLLVAAMVYSNRFSLDFFREAYCKIVAFLAVFSVVIYLLNIFVPSVLSILPALYNTAGNEFHSAIFSVTFPSLLFRNFGLFREPGVFMVYLNTALFFEWFSDKSSTKRVFIYLFTLLTTVSTAGFLIGAIIFSGGLLYNAGGTLHKKQIKNAFLALPLVLIAYSVIKSGDNIYSTLLLDKVADGGTGTAIIRVASFTVPMEIFLSHPFGVGPDGFNALFPVYTARMYGESFDGDLATATLFKQLAVYGILVFVFYFAAFVSFIKKCYRKGYLRFLLFVVLFLALGNEDMRTSLLFNMMIAYGLTSTKKNYLNNEVVLG